MPRLLGTHAARPVYSEYLALFVTAADAAPWLCRPASVSAGVCAMYPFFCAHVDDATVPVPQIVLPCGHAFHALCLRERLEEGMLGLTAAGTSDRKAQRGIVGAVCPAMCPVKGASRMRPCPCIARLLFAVMAADLTHG